MDELLASFPLILSFPYRPDTYLVTLLHPLIVSFPACHQNQEVVSKISMMIHFPLMLDKILELWIPGKSNFKLLLADENVAF